MSRMNEKDLEKFWKFGNHDLDVIWIANEWVSTGYWQWQVKQWEHSLADNRNMATMKACVQWARKDGFYPVFIRVNHHRQTLYIKTDKMVTMRELSRSKEITDPVVCSSTRHSFLTTTSIESTSKCNIKNNVCRTLSLALKNWVFPLVFYWFSFEFW